MRRLYIYLHSVLGLILITGCSATNFSSSNPKLAADAATSIPNPTPSPSPSPCNPTAFGSLCAGGPPATPVTNLGAHGFFYNLTPIPDPNGYAAGVGTYANTKVDGSLSLLTSADVIPNLDLYTTEISVAEQVWTAGFPGFPTLTEWFGVCYDASWTAPATESYTFVTAVDDSVAIWIDGNLIGENDDGNVSQTLLPVYLDNKTYNPGPVAFQNVTLAAGPHSVEVKYYQAWPTVLEVQIWVMPSSANYTNGTTPASSDYMQLDSPINGVMNCPH